MAIKKSNPTSAGQRFRAVASFDEVTKKAPEKSLLEETTDTLVISPDKKKLIAIKGLEGYTVVDTDDVLLICPKDDKKFKDFISEIAMPEFEKYR